ncbi:hypothetical protein C8Q70DRAFT_1058356 [Cubamyces menziesii]|uniref:Uncharacterized protein n=1 Tax=Trametes cubensis TaxID=1111947 RepID=A0AAD7TW79_9APHY|nr:hypothetical protein C8Q70DRAFT_1058356 [Cubamyces menziesii]KAJ8487311.1 hypothetical protein ONZ51_g4254 [Trametes cubensis]
MSLLDIVTSFGTDKAQYIVSEESTIYSPQGGTAPWERVMVVIVQILPEHYAIIIARPQDGANDTILFSAAVEDDWLFSCDEAQRVVKWKTPQMTQWAHLRLLLPTDFWLFLSQFAEARVYALRRKVETRDQLRELLRSFRTLFVMATARNATNPYDGRPDPEPARLGDDVQGTDSDSDSNS